MDLTTTAVIGIAMIYFFRNSFTRWLSPIQPEYSEQEESTSSDDNDNPVLISIEGNIGVGKSSFIQKLQQEFKDTPFSNDFSFLQEPVDVWCSIKDDKKNILQTFYDDKKRWSYTFQNLAYVSRLQRIEDTMNTTISPYVISDRSVDTDMNVFASMLKDDGYINDIEWQVYEHWNKLHDKYFLKQTKRKNVIYLRCSPQIVYDRIQKRGREEEKQIDINYIEKLHQYHDKWLLNNDKYNVLVIECDKDFVDDDIVFKEHFNNFFDFISEI